MKVRKEKDFLGHVEVPSSAYYGIHAVRAVENFPITGYSLDPDFIKCLAAVKKSAAMANRSLENLDKIIAGAICRAADEIMDGKWHDQFLVDVIQGGAGTSINMNMNEVLANRSLEILGYKKGDYEKVHPNNHVNMSQSTNDIVPTAVHICALQMGQKLLRVVRELANALERKAVEFDDVVKMGRTHLQDAVPIRLGQEFSAYCESIRTDAYRIENALDELKSINMGSTAVGTGLNADSRYIQEVVNNLSEITGLELQRAQNMIWATQDTGVYVQLSSKLRLLALDLGKIANDLRLMSSGPKAGFGEIKLPPRQAGSSIMPAKVNPVIPEVVNQVVFQVQGNDLTVSLASGAGQMELNVMLPVLSYNLFQSLKLLTNASAVFKERCITGIEANCKHCFRQVEHSVGLATALTPIIGYEEASQIAREAQLSNRTIVELVREKGLLSEEQCNELLDPFVLTELGLSSLIRRFRKKNKQK